MPYSVFPESLLFAGGCGEPDVYEQPFNLLKLTYSCRPLQPAISKTIVKAIASEDALVRREVSSRTEDACTKELDRSLSVELSTIFNHR